MASYTTVQCQLCNTDKIKWIVPDINPDRWFGNGREIMYALLHNDKSCMNCKSKYCVTGTYINDVLSKSITCNCGPLCVAIYNDQHQCADVDNMCTLSCFDHSIRSECEMYRMYWSIRYKYPQSRYADLYRHLCKYNISYSIYAWALCDGCINNVFKQWQTNEKRAKTDIAELTRECKCKDNTVEFITDKGKLYCVTCFPKDRNVYKLFGDLKMMVNTS